MNDEKQIDELSKEDKLIEAKNDKIRAAFENAFKEDSKVEEKVVIEEEFQDDVEETNEEELIEENNDEDFQLEVEEIREEPKEENNPFINNEAKEPESMEAIVEGLLYLVGEDGVKLEQLAKSIDRSLEDTEVMVNNIKNKYDSPAYGIELVAYGKVYKFITKKAVYPYAQELFNNARPNTLSQSALETLAIIAYKQPITRVEIEELRGVGTEMMLRRLLARNLIKEVGRSEAPGRPILYEVTEEFMDSFKLYSLNELPDLPSYSQDDENTDLFSND